MKSLAIITTHPIQYNAPLFRLIQEREKINLKVFYTWSQALEKFEDPDFGQSVQWDIPLLEGYEWEAVNNVANKPSSKSFFGVDNPELIAKIKAFNPDAILVFGWNHKSHLQVMRHFKGRIPIWFRGDSTLLDYNYQSLSAIISSQRPASFRPKQSEEPESQTKSPFTFHLSPFTSWLKFKLRTAFLKKIYSHIDKAFYVGTHNKAYYLHHGLKEDQLVYAPHAVDNERFSDNEERQYEKKARQWRRELGIPDEAKVILFAGKFEPKKNPGILIDAVVEINNQQSTNNPETRNTEQASSTQQQETSTQHPETSKQQQTTSNKNPATSNEHPAPSNQQPATSNEKPETRNQQPATSNEHPAPSYQQPTIHLILVGSGILENELRSKASNKSYIHFLPFQNQSQMPIVYRLGDVFCLPSQGPGETWGLAINEAMASGRPVIASNKCGGAIDLLPNEHIFQFSCHQQIINCIRLAFTSEFNFSIAQYNYQSIIVSLEYELNRKK